MKKKTILLIFGTRPEAIKMAPIIQELNKNKDIFRYLICVTGQHRQMLDQVLDLFNIEPDYDLNIMQPGQDLFDVTSKTLMGLRNILDSTSPDLVLVHGDTTTSIAAALAAFYRQIPIGHIEAGLRSKDIHNPWPEEANRQITSRLTTYHFAPTHQSAENLKKENLFSNRIIITGNTIIDALQSVLSKINVDNNLRENIRKNLLNNNITEVTLKNWETQVRRVVLITGHRRENFGEGFRNISESIKQLAIKYPEVDFVYPVHLNPNVLEPVTRILSHQKNIFLMAPLEYLPFVFLMKLCYLILTDSGGIQEEAPSLGKPVLVMRETTERPEAVAAGTVKLVGTSQASIQKHVSDLIDNRNNCYVYMQQSINPYGDGTAAKKIIEYLKNDLELL